MLYHIAGMAEVRVDWNFHVTTGDPPQLLRFVKQHYPKVEWHRPARTMSQLILDRKVLPTRVMRYCCAELKETGGDGRVNVYDG